MTDTKDNAPRSYVALSDNPMSSEELKKIGKPNLIVTQALHAWLKDDGEGHCFLYDFRAQKGTPFARRLWQEILPSEFKKLGRQIKLEEGQNAVNMLREKQKEELEAEQKRRRQELEDIKARKEFMDLREETDLPADVLNLDGEGKILCDPNDGCGEERFKPVGLNLLIRGEKTRIGNFYLIHHGEGNVDPVPLCRNCGELYRRNLPRNTPLPMSRSYTYADAVKTAEEQTVAAKKELERQNKLRQNAQMAGQVPDRNNRPFYRARTVGEGLEQEARDAEWHRNQKRDFRGGRRRQK